MKKYYEAYEERYKTLHEKGLSWASDKATPLVFDVIKKYGFDKKTKMLEIGCGEGRDAFVLLKKGYQLLATDISEAAIQYCRSALADFAHRFAKLDCINDTHADKYDFIYAIAVLHMLLFDEDRNAFYRFIRAHLRDDGLALICSMGDGKMEISTNAKEAFSLQERNHATGKMMVAATSCRMVSSDVLKKEIEKNGLFMIEEGIGSSLPDFNSLMYAIVKKGG